jgi:CubicO group peptidase (beta-lactamase class C family)
LNDQTPNWPPGSAHGYHVRTFGFLLDELVRRITGTSLSQYWRNIFAEPLGLDLWIGLPTAQNAKVANIYAAKAGGIRVPAKFYNDVATSGTFAHKVYVSPKGLSAVSEMNKPEIRALPIVSFNGTGSANSLAKFYAMLANGGKIDDREFFLPKTLGWMQTTLTDGIDRVFQISTAFSAGFMKDSRSGHQSIFGRSTDQLPVQLGPFGHPGAGGSHAFADPENKIAFTYVMNQMEQSVLPNEKSLRLVKEIYR